MTDTPPTILVIVGITGDLSTRKLLPAIEQMAASGMAPKQLAVLGITRRNVSLDEVLGRLPEGSHDFLRSNVHMHQMDLEKIEDYQRLSTRLEEIDQAFGGGAQRLFYLSVPPQISQPIVGLLGESGLSQGNAKLLLEKPFGVDLASAEEFIAQTKRYFAEDQIYRIDHYVAKHMVSELLDFRSREVANSAQWNKDAISRIEIVATEQIGIEGRAAFYEQTGALRDIVQSHLLQLTALTLMHMPKDNTMHDVSARRLAALHSLHLPEGPVRQSVVRGQYAGYREETKNPHTTVETFVRLNLLSDDPLWQGVPICLVTGKALEQKATEIRITRLQASQLIFRDQPGQLPDPYAQVLLNAIISKHALFTSSKEVLETWRILAPIQHTWSMSAQDLQLYEPGNAGPTSGQ